MPRFHLFWTGIFGGTFVFRNVQNKSPTKTISRGDASSHPRWLKPICIKTGVVSPRGDPFQNKTPPGHRHKGSSKLDGLSGWWIATPTPNGWFRHLASIEGTQTSRVRCTPQLIVIKNRPLLGFAVRFFPKKNLPWKGWKQKAFNTVVEGPRLGVFNQATLKVASSKGHWTPPKWCPWSKKAKTYQKMSKLRNFQTGQVRCYCWWEKSAANQVLYIPSGCLGFLPSTVWLWVIWKYRWNARGSLHFMSMFKENCQGHKTLWQIVWYLMETLW